MDRRMTVLESIIEDVGTALFQKWVNALPKDQQSEESIANLNKNATESTYFVVKMFMDKFNQEADQLKAEPNDK